MCTNFFQLQSAYDLDANVLLLSPRPHFFLNPNMVPIQKAAFNLGKEHLLVPYGQAQTLPRPSSTIWLPNPSSPK